MAPVTRRAAKASADSPREKYTTKEIPMEKPIALRSKRSERRTEDAKVATPKSKKLEVRIRENGDQVSTKKAIEVQIPSSAVKTPRSRSSPVPDSQETNASNDGDDNFEPLSASRQLEEEADHKLASKSRLRESGVDSTPVPRAAKSTRGSSAKKTRGGTTPKPQSRSQLESQSQDADPETDATPKPKAAAKSSHVVFGDDDDVDKFVAAAADAEKAQAPEAHTSDKDEGEEDDSDDDAPEAVSTAAAAKETLKSARAAIEAAEQFAATTKRKRQERDNLLKQQAQKRKRTDPGTSRKEHSSDEEGGDDKEDEEERNVSSKRQRRTQELPDLLPAEFLTDSSDDDEEDATALKKMVKRPQKINFETALQVLDTQGKRPRDEVVGSTRYRVLAEQGDPRLAPKADRNSIRAKEALLRRKRTGVTMNKKRGFFVKR
ncbi:hypothetical protein F5Y08DRAFT_336378 [Xylaria arbuscula]|nr:hypothetical protein F5Y08DRAFT_336378 [Xylaria arbuscula]